MGTSIRTTVLALAGCAIAASAAAQTPSSSLAEALSRSVCGRVQIPMAFATRDSAFALSLPADEPATIFLQVTVGKNGKVKEKLTRVDANHLAGYVAPAFAAATKDLRIDRSLLGNLSGKDTALTLAFPLEYQCVLDTTVQASRANAHPYQSRLVYDNLIKEWWASNRQSREIFPGVRMGTGFEIENPYIDDPRFPKPDSYSGQVSYYLVFLKDQPE